MRTWLARMLFVALAVAPAFGQQPAPVPPAQAQQPPTQQPPAQQQPAQQQPPVFRAGVKLVRVDVTVTGKGDQPITDLEAGDFDVTEDGVPQKVEQVQFVRLAGTRGAGDDALEIRTQSQAEAEAARDDVRVFALFLDDYHVDKAPDVMLPLRRALTDFVKQLWPTDLVAVMDPLTPLSALRFTRSKQDLLGVIQKFEGRQGEIFPVKSIMEEAQLMRGDIRRVRAEVTLSALEALAVRLGGLKEGRKTILFVSQGPPTFFGMREANLMDVLQDVTRAANRANVTIYTLDPRTLGLEGRLGARDTLLSLAGDTGGRAIYNTNDASRGLGQMLAENSAYYVIGYTPTRSEDDGKFHKISVKVRRAGTHVLARQGYWAPSIAEVQVAAEAAARASDPAAVQARETAAKVEPTRRPAFLWVGTERGTQGRTLVSLAWVPSNTPLAAVTASLDVEMLPAGQGPPLAPKRTLRKPAAGLEPALEPWELAPGNIRVKFTARSEEGSVVDDWTAAFTVPDLFTPPLALSTPRAFRARTLREWKALGDDPNPKPLAVWQFNRTDRILIAFDCYARTPDAAVEAHVLSRDGKELTRLPMPPRTGEVVRFELPVSSFGQGVYLLRVRAKAGTDEAEQLAAFRIQQ